MELITMIPDCQDFSTCWCCSCHGTVQSSCASSPYPRPHCRRTSCHPPVTCPLWNVKEVKVEFDDKCLNSLHLDFLLWILLPDVSAKLPQFVPCKSCLPAVILADTYWTKYVVIQDRTQIKKICTFDFENDIFWMAPLLLELFLLARKLWRISCLSPWLSKLTRTGWQPDTLGPVYTRLAPDIPTFFWDRNGN